MHLDQGGKRIKWRFVKMRGIAGKLQFIAICTKVRINTYLTAKFEIVEFKM